MIYNNKKVCSVYSKDRLMFICSF
ncbi:hypothetical protein PT2222_130206 [Paraburkholderia tropica]